MKASLPIFACLALLWGAAVADAQGPLSLGSTKTPAAQPAPPPAAEALLRQTIAQLDAQPSIAAKVRQKVELIAHPLIGSGIYLQQGRGGERQLRFELSMQTSGPPARMLQVSDGNTLWLLNEANDAKQIARVDLTRLRQARPKSAEPAAQPDAWLALGGLTRLLGSIEASFQFGPVTESRLDDLRVWTLEGTWKPARLAELLPEQREAINGGAEANLKKLPQLPNSVVLHLGSDDLFPYRIEYWRSRGKQEQGSPADRGKLVAVMELFEVQLGAAIDPRQFAFEPGDTKAADRTQAFLDRLGLEESPAAGATRAATPRR